MARLRLEGRPEELAEKAPEILKAVVERLPDSALSGSILDILEKAGLQKEQALKHPALRELHRRMGAAIDAHYQAMLAEIAEAIDPDPNQVKKAFDQSMPYYEADAQRYEATKSALAEFGYQTADFELGGELYGWSVNQLVELYRQLSSMQKDLLEADPDWFEIPVELGEPIWNGSLEKARTHKYIRRVPYTDAQGRRRYRYFYRITGGHGLGAEEEFRVGSAFRVGRKYDPGTWGSSAETYQEAEGHFHIRAVEGDQITIEHDESGRRHVLSADQLRSMLHREHATAIRQKEESLRREIIQARVTGTAKQRARLVEEADRIAKLFGSGGLRDLLKEPPKRAPDELTPQHRLYEEHRDLYLLLHNQLHELTFRSGRPEASYQIEPALQHSAQKAVDLMRGMWADYTTAIDQLEEARGTEHEREASARFEKLIRETEKQIGFVLGDRVGTAWPIRNLYRAMRALSAGGEVDERHVRGSLEHVRHLADFMDYKTARKDLLAEAKEPLTQEAAVVIGSVMTKARRNYFAEGYGSRTALQQVQEILQKVRTKRGIRALQTLLSPAYDAGQAVPSASMRSVIGGDWSSPIETALKDVERLERHDQDGLELSGQELIKDLEMAIENDVAELRRLAADPERGFRESLEIQSTRGDERGLRTLSRAEQQTRAIQHRFTQLPEDQSAVKRLFGERFGVRIHLEDATFDEFVEPVFRITREGETKLHRPSGALDGAQLLPERVKYLEKKDQARARRFLKFRERGFGAFAMDPATVEQAERGDKVAANEFREASEASFETRRRALKSIYSALTDLSAIMGTKVDLSGLPIVVSDQDVAVMANAHYHSARWPGALEREELQRTRFSVEDFRHKPHIGLGLGFEKSLGHEVGHYLDNRVSLRVADVQGMNRAVHEWVDSQQAGLSDPEWNELMGAFRAFETAMWDGKGNAYQQNIASYLVRARRKPEWQTAQGRRLHDHLVERFRALPGGEAILDLHEAVDQTGAYERWAERDERGSGSAMNRVIEELSGRKMSEEAKAYYQNGTEVFARLFEQHLHHELADMGMANPTLTHLVYDGEPDSDGPSAYFAPEEFKQQIQPKLRKVIDFLAEHMTKADQEGDLQKRAD